MKQRIRQLIALILTFTLVLSLFTMITVQAAGKIELPDLISDNMLVQRDAPIKLWGYGGTPGSKLIVTMEDANGGVASKAETTIGEDGFSITLPALGAGGPYTIRFADEKGEKLASVYNVLVGDLWFQGGQSNMQYRTYSVPEFVEERVTPNPTDDQIRLFFNGDHFRAEAGAPASTDLPGKWIIANKNERDWEYSAVGYGALEKMHNETGLPMGGICSPYGGTTLGVFNDENEDIYKAKIAPVTQMNIKGVMWYQGGTDATYGRTSKEIEDGYTKLLNLFRNKFANENLPFLLVQLHPSGMKGLKYGSDTEYTIKDYSPARVGQSNFYMNNENVGMAVALDLSLTKYKDKGEDAEHPWIKKPVADRLANVALEMVYGKDIKANSPVYTGYTIEGDTVNITVKDSYGGLKTSDGKEPWGFMVAGEDGIYYDAVATLSGSTIALKSENVPNPVSASYGIEYHKWPHSFPVWPNTEYDPSELEAVPQVPEYPVNVVNSQGLPLGAFITGESVATTGTQNTPAEQEPVEENTSSSAGEISGLTSGTKTILYVAPDGKDTNKGTIDSPFATLEKARDTILELKNAGKLAEGGAVVYFRGGDYVIKNAIEFSKEHSGASEDAPIIYRNYPGEEVNFLGAATLDWSNFKKVTDTAILNRIVDTEARNHVLEVDLFALGYTDLSKPSWPGPYSYGYQLPELTSFLEEHGITKPDAESSALFINGNEMTLARYPNDKQMIINKVVKEGSVVPAVPFEVIFDDPRVRNWTTADQAIITGTPQYSWGTLSTDLGTVNVETMSISSKYPVQHKALFGQHLHVYNLLEEIDIPNEYFVDVNTGKLYIYPPEETVDEVYYTILDKHMFWFQSYTKHITLKGINMKYMRAAAVVIGQATDNIQVIGCEITGAAGQTMTINGAKNAKIIDCYFHDTEGGIQCVNSGDRNNLTKGNNVIENCTFKNVEGKKVTYQPAINLTGVGNTARYNDISGSQHTVFCLGGNLHTVEFNEIYDACSNTDDMGAIYTGRNLTHRGNVFRYNYIHDIGSPARGGNGVHGMFFDDWWSAANVVGNVFENITGAGIMLAGSYNVMDNNMFINCSETMRLNRSYNYGNPDNDQVYIDGVNELKATWNEEVWLKTFPEIANAVNAAGEPDMNNYIVATNNVLYNSAAPTTSSEVAATATVENNIQYKSDPGFYDLANRNYLLKPDAQVYKDIPDFTPIPFTRMGSYTERALNRVKDATVFCLESPFVMHKSQVVDKEAVVTRLEDGKVYVSLRAAAEAVDGAITFDEATEHIVLTSSNGRTLEFTDGATANVTANGKEHTLINPIKNVNYTNYIALEDLAAIFNCNLTYNGSIAIVNTGDVLFNFDADTELLRYIEEQLTIY
ncbi:MAG: right-handed parallel beta-helix repeat-containing protein [Clostridia bacterium]|nr:right-handed parallel beta-helix repeat-containing protein [Clostridia bacterium]